MTVMWLALGLGVLLLAAAVMHAVWPSILDKKLRAQRGETRSGPGVESQDQRFPGDIARQIETSPRAARLDEQARDDAKDQLDRPSVGA